MCRSIIMGVQRVPHITEEYCHEDPDYRASRDRGLRNVRGREDPATQGGSSSTHQLRETRRGDPKPNPINSHCRFDRGETDPDRRIVLQLHRDCRDWEFDEAE